MSFTVDDFQDLVRLLGQHPEWRSELRRLLLSEELLELPALVRRLAEAQDRTDRRLERLEATVERLAEDQERTAAYVQQLVVGLAELSRAVTVLTRDSARLTDDVATLKGEAVERRYRERAPAYFGRLVRRLRLVERMVLADALDTAVERGTLTEAEREAVLLADLVATGRRVTDQAEVYLLAEVSAGVGRGDVERAAGRAAALAKLGRPVIPIVAGDSITAEAAGLARRGGVWQVLDGQLTPPDGASG